MGGPNPGRADAAPPGSRLMPIRYQVLAAATGMAVLLYLDRICLAAAIPAIGDEFHLDKEQKGQVLSAFFLTYSLFQVPAGWLGDRFGARLVLSASILVWSLFTGLTGLAQGLLTLIAFRLLVGVGQAGAYPISARVFSRWMPFRRRGLASSIVSLGGRAGGALAPGLTAFLIVGWGAWRPVLWLYAGAGVVFAAAFWAWFRNTPREHPGCAAYEIALIETGRPPGVTDPDEPAAVAPWGDLLASRSLWLQCLSQFATNVGWTLLITWLPSYLMEVYNLNLERAGLLSSLPLLAGMAGCLLGGIATDRFTQVLGLRWGRSLLGILSQWLAGAGLVWGFLAGDPILAVSAFAFASFATDLGLGATWAYFQDAGGPYVGTFLGWANMFGNLGGFVSPLLLGFLAQRHGWPTALGTCAGFFLLAGLFWFGVDARVPIIPPTRKDRPA